MAADYTIHIVEQADLERYKRFQSNVLGSRWFEYVPYEESSKHFDEDYHFFAETPHMTIGEVSWLKAALFEDRETFVPDFVDRMSKVFGEGDEYHVIDGMLLQRLREAGTGGIKPHLHYAVSDIDAVIKFLERYPGKYVIAISW